MHKKGRWRGQDHDDWILGWGEIEPAKASEPSFSEPFAAFERKGLRECRFRSNEPKRAGERKTLIVIRSMFDSARVKQTPNEGESLHSVVSSWWKCIRTVVRSVGGYIVFRKLPIDLYRQNQAVQAARNQREAFSK
ncbi:hypothetical protein ZHAS_00010087 [Anopheles sinensis]|uniref:Uncharacterized protein n=1 Tax=Anopheles sinensis TaxID=74873 RepID=A0A084VWP9_ANOSI|nr:hypothetical protein ZHAS_00010087 [Anopheles sinensis]